MDLKNYNLLKNLLKWANKKQNTFKIYHVAFFKKNKHAEISLFYTCAPKFLIVWSTVPKIRVWQTQIRNFRSFFTFLLPEKHKTSKIWKNEKHC